MASLSVEWVTYDPQRDERPKGKGLCAHRQCGDQCVVIKYERIESNDPTFLCEQHAREDGWSGASLVLGEAELSALLQMSGDACSYDDEYAMIGADSAITFWTEPSEYQSLRAFRLKFTSIVDGHIELDDHPGTPPCRLFEATVLRSTVEDNAAYGYEVGENVAGIIFPAGFASVFSADLASDYANRCIWAMIALNEGEKGS